ncbi:MAG: GPW/gp25 family protein [candidate division Zixibacteria bacterium]|nr:GPW/gp25 family protein [candidate division Zixibacteria bacterium]
MEYLALPFELKEDYLSRTENLKESIVCSIGLLLSTRRGAMHFLPEFGCDIWEMEFSDIYTANKATVRASLRNAIAAFEKRLSDVSVSFSTDAGNRPHVLGISVKVTGLYREDGEEKKFESSFLLG